jgi:hypothetical protein
MGCFSNEAMTVSRMALPIKPQGVLKPIYLALGASLLAHGVLVSYLWRAWEHQQVRHASFGTPSALNFQVRVTAAATVLKTVPQQVGGVPMTGLLRDAARLRKAEVKVDLSVASEEQARPAAVVLQAKAPLPMATVFQGSAALWGFGGQNLQGLQAAYQAQHARDITRDLQTQAQSASLGPAPMNVHTNCTQAGSPDCIALNKNAAD